MDRGRDRTCWRINRVTRVHREGFNIHGCVFQSHTLSLKQQSEQSSFCVSEGQHENRARFRFDDSPEPRPNTFCISHPGILNPGVLMNIYHDDVFQMACDQFAVIADYLNIDHNDRDRLMYPKRAVAVTLPVHMDDG